MALTVITTVTITILFAHSAHLIDADLQRPLYVSQRDAGHSLPRRWNTNQRHTIRGHQQQMSQSTARQAKQIVYTDEPVPYYHSYKFMAFGQGEGSTNDQFDHGALRRNHNYNNELSWYNNARSNPPVVRAPISTAPLSSTKTSRRQQTSTATKGEGGRSGTKGGAAPRRTPAINKSGNKWPSNRRHHHKSPELPDWPVAGHESPLPAMNRTDVDHASASGRSKKKNLVCYYGTWAVYRPDAGKYPVENIDPFLCTHIIYGFTGLSYDNLIKPLDPWNDLEDNYGKGAMKRFTNLKRINPDLKTLVAIGGWNEGSIKYSKMASEPESRAKFVASVVQFLSKFNFDGLDLDWEYPGARGGKSYDKQNFVSLLRELHQAFKPHNYLLTAAVSAGKWFIDPAYDIPQVSKYLDLINLMAYDYHGGWETKTGMNAPLFHSPQHDLKRDEALLNVNWSVNYWLQMGAAPEKIMLGVGSYGRSFTLDKASVNGINAPASQKGQAGPYTREPGSLGYNEICETFQRQPHAWTIVRDPDYLAPYAYNDRQWVGYDDMQSLALKAQYAKSMGLGGMMMWSIETDDFLGRCHNEKYPLLNTIKRVMNDDTSNGNRPTKPTPLPVPVRPTTGAPPVSSTQRPTTVTGRPTAGISTSTSRRPAVTPTTPGLEVEDEVPSSSTTRRPPSTSRRPKPPKPSTTTTTTTTTTSTPTQKPTGGEFVCRSEGMFADPKNCRKFIRCVNSGGGLNYSIFRFDCGPGTAFNQEHQYCDHIYNVPNCSRQINNNPNSNLIQLRSHHLKQEHGERDSIYQMGHYYSY